MNTLPMLKLIEDGFNGTSVDWRALSESSRDEDDRRVLARLGQIHDIARFHRSLQRAEAAAVRPLRSPEAAGPTVGTETLESPTPAVTPRSSEPEVLDRWGKLLIRKRIGKGGYGEVFLAQDPDLDRHVALKLYDPAPIPRPKERGPALLREGRLMARVRHPNVVGVHGAEIHEGRVGIWMEYIKGQTLAGILGAQGPMAASEAALIGLDLCRALAAVHARGIIHQDVKPQNVMREQGGRIVLMDFGIGVEVDADSGSRPPSGTPLYMAPETFLGGKVTRACDVYSLGVLLYHLVTGRFPVETENLRELIEQHRKGRHLLLRDVRPDLPPAFVAAVEKALAANPEERYRSMGEMEKALSEAAGGLNSLSAAQLRRSPLARVFRWWIAAPLGAAVLVGAYFVLRGPNAPEKPPGAVAPAAESPRGSPPSPQPAVLSEGEFAVKAEFRRVSGGNLVDLKQGDRVGVGDQLVLKMRLSTPLYVYVVSRDASGNPILNFPLASGQGPGNPLPAGQEVWLPASKVAWRVDTPGRNETFLCLATRERDADLEQELSALARPSAEAASRPLSRGAIQRLRSVGGLAPIPDAAEMEGGIGDLFETAPLLGTGTDTVSGRWIRKLELRNP